MNDMVHRQTGLYKMKIETVSARIEALRVRQKNSRLEWPLLLTLEAIHYRPKITKSYCQRLIFLIKLVSIKIRSSQAFISSVCGRGGIR